MRGKYMAFGLTIDSPLPLPEAFPVSQDTPADVTIAIDTVVEDFVTDDGYVYARENRSWWHSMTRSRMLFNCKAGLFDIRNGCEITVQLYPDADMENAKIFLLGSAMGALQIQRGYIPLHGGAVVTQNGAMIITGGQSAGKSTMTSAFVHNRYRYITDDVSSIFIENGQAYITPAYPQRKLVRNACAPLGYDPQDLILVDRERDKLAVRDRGNWYSEPANLSIIIELHPETPENSVSVEQVTGHPRLDCVIRNLYRKWMHIPGGDMAPTDFKKILTIAAQTDIYRVYVPRDLARIALIARDIADALEKYKPGVRI